MPSVKDHSNSVSDLCRLSVLFDSAVVAFSDARAVAPRETEVAEIGIERERCWAGNAEEELVGGGLKNLESEHVHLSLCEVLLA